MDIYILRHGIAEDGGPGQPDAERALTGEGRDKLKRVLERAATADVSPGVILTSPYKRAVQTAEIAAEVLGYKGKLVKVAALTPDGSPELVWEEIKARKTEDSILLSSHEPLTGRLVAHFLSCPTLQVDMKKGALARVNCERFGPEPRGVLKWMLTAALSAR